MNKSKATPEKGAMKDKQPAKAATTSTSWRSASAFILSFPENVKPMEIVTKAKQQGFKITPGYAATIRSKAKKSGNWSKGASAPTVRMTTSRNDDEMQFMKLMGRLGEDRVQNLVDLYMAAHNRK